MSFPTNSIPKSLEPIVERIFSTHRITRADQRWFMSVMLSKDSLNPEDQNLISRVFEGVKKGSIRVVD